MRSCCASRTGLDRFRVTTVAFSSKIAIGFVPHEILKTPVSFAIQAGN
jgi:hypothetical protein